MRDPVKPVRMKGALAYRAASGFGKLKGVDGGWWYVPAVEFPENVNLRVPDVVTFDAYPAVGAKLPVARALRLYKRGFRHGNTHKENVVR